MEMLVELLLQISTDISTSIGKLRNKFKKEPHPAQVEDSKRLRVKPTVYPSGWIDKENPRK